jgi:hypothetical protein
MREEDGSLTPPARNQGKSITPVVGLSAPSGVGITPRIGGAWRRYGFERVPYATMVAVEAERAMDGSGWRAELFADQRLERSPLHFSATAQVSDLEIVRFHGFGSTTSDTGARGFYDVQQRQWTFRPAIAVALNARSDVTLGPILQYSVTDSLPNTLLAATRPYGFGQFKQAGAQLALNYQWRSSEVAPRYTWSFGLEATHFPAVWDVDKSYQSASASAGAALKFPIPTQPTLVVRGGAKHLFGEFPFHDAAFIGGRRTTRLIALQRFAGDESLFLTSELRFRLFSFLVLAPLEGGVAMLGDVGRVSMDGESPGGWHTGTGVGAWIGLRETPAMLVLAFTYEREGRGFRVKTGLTF